MLELLTYYKQTRTHTTLQTIQRKKLHTKIKANRTSSSAIAEKPRCRLRYSFRQKYRRLELGYNILTLPIPEIDLSITLKVIEKL